jgi:hypothetical protein
MLAPCHAFFLEPLPSGKIDDELGSTAQRLNGSTAQRLNGSTAQLTRGTTRSVFTIPKCFVVLQDGFFAAADFCGP